MFRSDLAVYCIKVFDRNSQKKINEISNLIDKPEYLVFSPKYNILAAKVTKDCITHVMTLHTPGARDVSQYARHPEHLESGRPG